MTLSEQYYYTNVSKTVYNTDCHKNEHTRSKIERKQVKTVENYIFSIINKSMEQKI